MNQSYTVQTCICSADSRVRFAMAPAFWLMRVINGFSPSDNQALHSFFTQTILHINCFNNMNRLMKLNHFKQKSIIVNHKFNQQFEQINQSKVKWSDTFKFQCSLQSTSQTPSGGLSSFSSATNTNPQCNSDILVGLVWFSQRDGLWGLQLQFRSFCKLYTFTGIGKGLHA